MSFDEKDIELMKKIKNISDEEIEIPEVLSPENMMKTIEERESKETFESGKEEDTMENNVINSQNLPPENGGKKKKYGKKILMRVLAVAASVALVTGGVYGASKTGLIKWNTKTKDNNGKKVVENSKDGLGKKEGCKDYKEIAKVLSNVQDRYAYSRYINGGIVEDEMDYESAVESDEKVKTATDDSVNAGEGTDSKEYTGTNVQVEGIDEGDIVKTDGDYIYAMATQGQVSIVSTDKKEKVATINPEIEIKEQEYDFDYEYYYYGYDSSANNQMLLLEDKLVLVLDEAIDTDTEKYSRIEVYDISDRSKPQLINAFNQEGNVKEIRLVDDKLFVITNTYIYGDIDEDNCVPRIDGKQIEPECVYLPEVIYSSEYVFIVSMDLSDDGNICDKKALTMEDGWYDFLYMSDNNIFVSTYTIDEDSYLNGGSTVIWRFGYKDGKMEDPVRGIVEGYLYNQFAMDEYDGYLRVVSTRYEYEEPIDGDYWYSEGNEINKVSVLKCDTMDTVGVIDGIAKDEKIYSARYEGNTGYFVTYRQIDPLFTVDFSDPTNPVITDELEVPGFSSYLHKYADNLLLGIGRDEGSLKLSMFETDEDGKQTEVAKYLFREERKDEDVSPYASSTAEDNHRALMIDTENNIFGFDVNTYVYHVITNPDDELLNSVKDEAVAVYKEKYKTNETDDTYLQEYLKELEDPGNHYVYLDEDILTYDVFTYQDGEFVKLASIPLYEYYNVNGENTVSDDVLSQYENNYRNVRGIIIEDELYVVIPGVKIIECTIGDYENTTEISLQ